MEQRINDHDEQENGKIGSEDERKRKEKQNNSEKIENGTIKLRGENERMDEERTRN